MKKKMLITSTDLMMIQFLVPHVVNLTENGYEVEIACSEVGDRMDEVREKLKNHVKAIHVVRLVRSPASLINIKGYGDMKKVVAEGNYDIIWTNEPVMGVVTRLAARKARKKGTKVVYMVHGFHFYKGAPKLNWMVYYPIERWMSRLTDMIVTINKEDYGRAKGFHAKRVEYIPGIGIDLTRYNNIKANTREIRQSLGINTEDYLLISIGELTKRKNHRAVLDALKMINDPRVKYIICGRGPLRDDLFEYIHKSGLDGQVSLLGYRRDICQLCKTSDLFVFPSRQEGLSVALMEAMACGMPVICSAIRGNTDLIEEGKGGYLTGVDDSGRIAQGIRSLANTPGKASLMGQYNKGKIENYSIDILKDRLLHMYNSLEKDKAGN